MVNSFIWPFSARWIPTNTPPKSASNTERIEKFTPASLSSTETSTAKTVIKAAVTLLDEIGFGPPPVKPIRSTINDVAVWPAIEATEKSATPITGTT